MSKANIGDIIVHKEPYSANLKLSIVELTTKTGSPMVKSEWGGLYNPRSTIINVTQRLKELGYKIVKDE